ncbi:hypothetical protein [Ruegeria profundi]|uniref:hypothetical protein n=1 Tax=Ruegeria profundi TaxID=1685378 RepID=UPI00196A0768|nr:hypothetical protein [Ruegeria profundi]
MSIAALLALFFLSPHALQTKAFSTYFQLGIIISLSTIVGIIVLVLKHRGWGASIRSTIGYIVFDPPSVFAALTLTVYLVCAGLNLAVFWLVLLLAGLLTTIGREGRQTKETPFQRLSRADRKPGFLSEQFLFPVATAFSCAAIFAIALSGAEVGYRSVFWILLIATTARLVGYSASDMSPATEGLTENLRRRYSRPRLMYFLLLVLEGGSLLFLLTSLRSNGAPPLPSLYEYKETFLAIYQPDSWYNFVTSSLGIEEYFAAFSAIMFNVSLLSYVVQFSGLPVLVGKDDPFKITDSDFIALAEYAIQSDHYTEAEKYLGAVQIHTNASRETELRLWLARGDVESAARAAQECRELCQQKTDSSSVFRQMMREVRKQLTSRHTENQVLKWAVANGVSDEELAHALIGFTPGSSGLNFVKDALVALGFFKTNPTTSNSQELETQLHIELEGICRDYPLCAFVVLKLGLPEFKNDELHAKVFNNLMKRSYSILGEAILAVFSYNEDVLETLKTLSERYGTLINAKDVDADELLGPLPYFLNLIHHIERPVKGQEKEFAVADVDQVLAIWNNVNGSARNDRELVATIRHIRKRLRRVKRRLS